MDARLLLVDAMALAYRSFYGISELATADGRPTNALFGFIRGIEQLRAAWNPTHALVVFDGGLPPERVALLPGYKEGRPSMPDRLRMQLEPITRYIRCKGLAQVCLQGVEADDIMASVACWAANEGARVYLATSDKDLYQIVSDRIRVVPLSKRGTAMGVREVELKTGVQPGQVVDWLALVGDAADNIPGVPGVGAKTAAKWLREYGSVEELLRMAGTLKPARLARIFWEERGLVARNRKIVRLSVDVPGPLSWTELEQHDSDLRRLREFFEEFELRGFAV